MRLDRVITIMLSGLARSSCAKIPILMYHSISNNLSHAKHPYFETVTTPIVFRRHMQLLYNEGYKIIRLCQLKELFPSMIKNETKYAIITFDDGYDDFYINAFPVLQSFGFTASVFLPTKFIDAVGPGLEGRKHVTWEQVRVMKRAGIDFGSHTVDHPQLVTLQKKDVVRQLVDSKECLEKNIGSSIDTFAYPYRFPEENKPFVAMVRGIMENAGYSYGVCTSIGSVKQDDERMFLKRQPVNDFDDDDLFKAKLLGAYDWVHGPQLLTKKIKALLGRA